MKFDPCFIDPNEKPLDTLAPCGGNCAIFRTIACVGDSLSSGEFESVNADGSNGYHDYFDYSWGQFMARMTGSKVYNFSRGGMTAREYCTGFADANRFWNAEYAAQAYIIALGCNDVLNEGQPMGTVDDIDLNDWRNNADTFTGWYARIIQRYHEMQPRAFFFLMTMADDGADDGKPEQKKLHAQRLYEMARLFPQTYVLDLYAYGPKYDRAFRDRFFMSGHMNPAGYLLTAQMTASYIDYIIRHNPRDFNEVGFIGTDLHGKPGELWG